jgi:hypothetical protein
MLSSQVDVGTSVIPVPQDANPNPKNLPGRRRIYLKNNSTGSAVIYIGDAAVGTATGYPLTTDIEVVLDITDDIQLFAVADAADRDLRILELA